MRKRSRRILLATEIVPGRIYMVDHGPAFCPVKLITGETIGWLRGFVMVDRFSGSWGSYRAYSKAHLLESGAEINLVMERSGPTPWQFSYMGQPTLWEMPPDWLDTQKRSIKNEMDKLTARLNFLSTLE